MFVTSTILILWVGISAAQECPSSTIISPCTCDNYFGLRLSCYDFSTEEELRTIFHRPDFPITDFAEISITHGGFESLGADLFGQLTADIVTIENNNNLKSVDVNLLRGPMSEKARWITISKNPLLREADLRVLEVLTRTDVTLEMRENGATTIIPPSIPTNVHDLNLGRNSFSELSADMLVNLVGLRYLYLYECGISSIQAGTFASLTNMTDLQLHNNELGPTLQYGALEFPLLLDSLTLDNNNIETVLPGAISGFSPSAYLSLWSNHLNSFPEETYRPILERLNLGGGSLSLYYNFDLPCEDCSIVWLFLNAELLDSVDKYYCDPATQITDVDSAALIAECALKIA